LAVDLGVQLRGVGSQRVADDEQVAHCLGQLAHRRQR